jgi:hypothetical protein
MNESENRPMSVSEARHPDKLAFTLELLKRDPEASRKAVNKAWRAAGYKGTISEKSYGRALNESARVPRAEASKSPNRQGRLPTRSAEQPAAPEDAQIASVPPLPCSRERLTEELEADLDRILFKVMDAGDLPALERMIRETRRLLILGGRGVSDSR